MAKHIPRLYIPPAQSDRITVKTNIVLTDTQYHHLVNVLRMQPKETVILFNAQDGEWKCNIESITKVKVLVNATQQLRQCLPLPELHIYFSPIRKEHLLDILIKGTELGVTHFHPIITKHTVHECYNLPKLNLHIQNASEQCGRCELPILLPSKNIVNVLDEWQPNTKLLVAIEPSASSSAKSSIPEGYTPFSFLTSKPEIPVHLAIGPEGGWSNTEKELFFNLPFIQPFNLGNLILRSETAAIASLSLVNYLRTLNHRISNHEY